MNHFFNTARCFVCFTEITKHLFFPFRWKVETGGEKEKIILSLLRCHATSSILKEVCLHFVHQLITIIIFVSSFLVHIGSSNSWIYDENDFIMPPTWTQSQRHHHPKHQDLWMSWWNDRSLVNQFYYLNTSILLNSPILLSPSFFPQKHLVILKKF